MSNLKVPDKLYTRNYQNKKIFKIMRNDALNILKKTEGFNPKCGSKILDVGCGAGVFDSIIKNKYSSIVYGIDINKAAITSAVKFGIKAQVADIENRWPFENNFFDFVVMVQVIEHVLNTDHVILEARRVLRKGGTLLITTPNLASWFNRLIFLFGFQPFFTEISIKDKTLGLKFTRRITENKEPLGHIRVFTQRGLLDFLNHYGFEMKSVKGGSVSYFPTFMKVLDKFFSLFPSLATDSIVVATKSK